MAALLMAMSSAVWQLQHCTLQLMQLGHVAACYSPPVDAHGPLKVAFSRWV